VVVAQVVVAAPFYVQSAAAGFRAIDDDLLLVARTLGASPRRAVLRVAVPLALPALINGAALCWARALGEFGATLLFAGSFPGRTQTMPLAIYAALEADVRVATAIALVLALVAFATLLTARAARRGLARATGSSR
jgi:molybdate transport system permease protein